jgi:spore coat protein CotH
MNMVRVYISDIDAYDKNYYLYANPLTSQPARTIAWDCDASWGNSWTGYPVTYETRR